MKLDEQTLMVRDLVRRFVEREMMPLEPQVLGNQIACDDGAQLTAEQEAHLRKVSKELGL